MTMEVASLGSEAETRVRESDLAPSAAQGGEERQRGVRLRSHESASESNTPQRSNIPEAAVRQENLMET